MILDSDYFSPPILRNRTLAEWTALVVSPQLSQRVAEIVPKDRQLAISCRQAPFCRIQSAPGQAFIFARLPSCRVDTGKVAERYKDYAAGK